MSGISLRDKDLTQQRPRPRREGLRRLRSTAITEGDATRETLAREGFYRRSLAVADVLAAVTAVAAASVMAGEQSLALLAVVPVMVALNKASGLYDRDELVLTKTTLDEFPSLVSNGGLFALVVWLYDDLLTTTPIVAGQTVLLWTVAAALLPVTRSAARRLAARVSPPERCLIAGEAAAREHLAAKLLGARANVSVVGHLPLRPESPFAPTPDHHRLFRERRVHRLIMAPVSADASDSLELIRSAKAAGVRVSVVPRLFEVVGSSVEFDHLDGLTVLGVRRFGLSRSSRLIKRMFDVVVASAALLATAPLMVAIAIAIRLDSPGPLFFRQTRAGRDGVPFEMLKFRSMVRDADAMKAQLIHLNEARNGMFKIAADPRVTRVGRFCRKTSLDELPQLINVVRGQMSLVGPRPLVLDEDARVTGYDRARLHLTPGMTGHWQILGSARIPMDEMLGIDYLYVANWTLWTDVKILLRTVPYVLAQRSM